jgi:hypothetical protein
VAFHPVLSVYWPPIERAGRLLHAGLDVAYTIGAETLVATHILNGAANLTPALPAVVGPKATAPPQMTLAV